MSHQRIDLRSLAYGRLIADRIRADPALIDRARAVLALRLSNCSADVRPALLDWEFALQGPSSAVLDLLTSADDRATRLRQSSPFAGVLTAAARTAVILALRRVPVP